MHVMKDRLQKSRSEELMEAHRWIDPIDFRLSAAATECCSNNIRL